MDARPPLPRRSRARPRRVADLALAEIGGLALKGVITLADLLEDPSPAVRNYAVRNERRVIETIVHGFAEVRGPRGKTCKCPARVPLPGPADYMRGFP